MGVEDLASVLRLTEAYKRIRLRDKAYFQDMISTLGPYSCASISIAKHNSLPMAGALVAALGRKVWDLYAGVNRNGMPGASHALTYDLMLRHLNLGYRFYDLGGVPLESSHEDGLTAFKRQFGGERVVFIGEYRLNFPLLS